MDGLPAPTPSTVPITCQLSPSILFSTVKELLLVSVAILQLNSAFCLLQMPVKDDNPTGRIAQYPPKAVPAVIATVVTAPRVVRALPASATPVARTIAPL